MADGNEVVRHRDSILGRLGGTLARVTSQGRAELAEKKRPHLVGCCPLSHSVPVGPKPEDKSQYFRYITGGPDDNTLSRELRSSLDVKVTEQHGDMK
jgi:hypothetical protein